MSAEGWTGSRRDPLLAGAAGLIVGGGADDARADLRSEPRGLRLVHVTTGENLDVEYWNGERCVPDASAALDRFLRDFHRGVEPIARRLLNLVWIIQRWSGPDEPFQVVSGYRAAETNAMLREGGNSRVAVDSYHIRGMAIDLRLPGLRLDSLRRAARRARGGGVGYYPESRFVHLDVGARDIGESGAREDVGKVVLLC